MTNPNQILWFSRQLAERGNEALEDQKHKKLLSFMKQPFKILALIAAIGGLTSSSRADLTNTYQNFDSFTVGAYNPTYGSTYVYSGGAGGSDIVANVTNGVVNGASISGNAVEFTATAAASGDNFGVHSVNYDMPLTNNFSPNKSDYTVSFDIALGAGSVNDFTADFVLYGGDGTTGQAMGIDASTLTPGGGFVHESFKMSDMAGAYQKTALIMNTITNMSWSLGKYGGSTAGTADVFIDNILITTTATGTPVPVAIATQPTSQTVFAGQSATFTLQATGYPLPTIQWRTNNVDVAGATGATFIIPSATTNMSGVFVTALVSNSYPSSVVSTNNVTLTVVPASGPMVFTSLSASPTANAGYLQGYGTFTVKNSYPAVSTNVPTGPYAPATNFDSVDFGIFTNYDTNSPGFQAGGRAINFTNTIDASGTPVGNLGAFSAFTVCGWINCGSSDMGYGGNRIVYCNDGSGTVGFDLSTYLDVDNTIGLQLGVNSWSDYPAAGPTSGGYAPVDPAEGAANWTFFAVTYDGTQTDNNVNYYWGDGNDPAFLYFTTTYNQGPITKSGMFSIGNANQNTFFATGQGSAGDVRSWRGLIDEVRVYSSVLTLAQIQAAQVAPATATVVPPTPVPLSISPSGGNVILSWTDPTGLFKLATGADVTAITNVVSNTSPYTNSVSDQQRYFRLVYP